MPENTPPRDSESDDPGAPVPNRRERRGGKSKSPTPQGTGPVQRHLPPGVQQRRYNARRGGR